MTKISLFLSFLLFVLIAMPASSSSRMILEGDQEIVVDGKVNTCPPNPCRCLVAPQGCTPPRGCRNGSASRCCECPTCCPAV
ncbi:hypothetical protein MKX03_006076 [Papaver bracteatum]|nr:hypothetical protein MKX03_006076 [Papaver bracteatum]